VFGFSFSFQIPTMSEDWVDVSVAQDGGVKKHILRAAADDAEKPQAKYKCRVHYTGILTDTSASSAKKKKKKKEKSQLSFRSQRPSLIRLERAMNRLAFRSDKAK
jgi:hypothetical protein